MYVRSQHHPPERDEALIACMRAAQEMVDEVGRPLRHVSFSRLTSFFITRQGLVRSLGLCNVSVRQIKAVLAAGVSIVSVQNELSIWKKTAANALKDEKGATGVVDFCAANGITFIGTMWAICCDAFALTWWLCALQHTARSVG